MEHGTGPAYQQLAADLRAQILAGEMRPGDRLPIEPELSARYGVSRSTVREALRVLSSQHLITTTRGVTGGSFVAHPSPDQVSTFLEIGLSLMTLSAGVSVDDLLGIRELLEVPAAGLAARHRDRARLDRLRANLFDPGELGPAEMYPRNRAFHDVLLEMAGNPLLAVVTQPVFRVLDGRFVREAAPKRFWRQVDADHRQIADAVERGDEQAARQAMHDHLVRNRRTYTRIDRVALAHRS